MSGGKTLEDLIKEHKPEENKAPALPVERAESEEERKKREDRLKAMQNRLANKSKIDDRGVQQRKFTILWLISVET